MKKSLIIIIFALAIMFPSTAKAACSNQQLIRMQKIASNISTSYTYREVNGKVVFDVTITNMTNDVYLYDFINKRNIYYTGKPITIYGYASGLSFNYTVRSNLIGCKREQISNIYINLPTYNKYYKNALCEGISSFELCNKWYNAKNLSYDDFKSQVEAYKKSLETVVDPEPTPEEPEPFSEILFRLISEYYYIILIPIIIIAGGSIYVLRKNEEII